MSETIISSDTTLLDLIRQRGGLTVAESARAMGVTATAARQRLTRLMDQGYVERSRVNQGRGRPVHQYRLTEKGRRRSGTNFADLAVALWKEIRAIDDPEVRRGLVVRLSRRLAEMYADRLTGETVEQRMAQVRDLFAERRIPLSLEAPETGGELPVLAAWSCPYPELAEQDRGICSLERLMFAELLRSNVRLSHCRLDGDACCTFEVGRN